MPSEASSFAALMQRVQSNAEGAAHELLQRYGGHILRAVRQKLNTALRSKFDSTDFVQAVWASFFALPLDQYAFDQSAALGGFLARMAQHKVIEAVRQRLQTEKYNVNRERPLDDPNKPGEQLAVGREPSPQEIAIAREEWEKLLAGKPLHYQQILTSLREGNSQKETAAKVGVNEKTIRRMLAKTRPRDDT